MSAPVLSDQAARDRIANNLDANLAVEAAAGTGKTTVLVDRVVKLLASGKVNVDQLVVITFTEKAAAELATRVRDELELRALTAEGQERMRLLIASRDLYRAHIETIHSFATALLRERPVEAGIDPLFEVLEGLAAGLDFAAELTRVHQKLRAQYNRIDQQEQFGLLRAGVGGAARGVRAPPPASLSAAAESSPARPRRHRAVRSEPRRDLRRAAQHARNPPAGRRR